MDCTVPGRKAMLRDILSLKLPDTERAEFREWSEGVSSEDFFRVLPVYFNETEITNAIAEYINERITELEHFCDVRIDAVITVAGSQFEHRCYNEVMQV